jgi:hypothetical protein
MRKIERISISNRIGRARRCHTLTIRLPLRLLESRAGNAPASPQKSGFVATGIAEVTALSK